MGWSCVEDSTWKIHLAHLRKDDSEQVSQQSLRNAGVGMEGGKRAL
jgi:hypothetical protein